MKSKPVPGSLFGLLVRNYLLFTLTLLLIAGGIFLLWNAWLDRLFRPADWSGLMSDPALISGNYERLDRYVGSTGSAFAVWMRKKSGRSHLLDARSPRMPPWADCSLAGDAGDYSRMCSIPWSRMARTWPSARA